MTFIPDPTRNWEYKRRCAMTIDAVWPEGNKIMSAKAEVIGHGFRKDTETTKVVKECATPGEAEEICRKVMQGEMQFVVN